MSTEAIWESERGVFIRTLVHPKSRSKEFISEITPEALHINLTSPAREGKANVELVKRLSKILGVSTSEISIIGGHRSREKTVLVRGISLDQVKRAILL
ncbi:MAG: DUF167 domain-containing protein [Candidatus Thorarchaeota archaeon]